MTATTARAIVPDIPEVACEKHKTHPWRGHILCGSCGRTYQTLTPGIKTYAPRVCECGENLLPYVGDAQDGVYTACALCVKCYVQIRRDHGGRLPPIPDHARQGDAPDDLKN